MDGILSTSLQKVTPVEGGRPKGVDEKKRKAALALKRDPNYSVREICEIVGISRNTYYKYSRE
jgi:hypothetical protein